MLAMLSVAGAVAILTAGIAAAFADRGEPDPEPPKSVPVPDEHPQVTPLGRRNAPRPADRHDRKAA